MFGGLTMADDSRRMLADLDMKRLADLRDSSQVLHDLKAAPGCRKGKGEKHTRNVFLFVGPTPWISIKSADFHTVCSNFS